MDVIIVPPLIVASDVTSPLNKPADAVISPSIKAFDAVSSPPVLTLKLLADIIKSPAVVDDDKIKLLLDI